MAQRITSVLFASMLCAMIITRGVCQNASAAAPGPGSVLAPPRGWMDVVKAYMNTMANNMAGWGGWGYRGGNVSVTNNDKSLMTDAVNRYNLKCWSMIRRRVTRRLVELIDAFERTLGNARGRLSTGFNTAINRNSSWVNNALNWLTGK